MLELRLETGNSSARLAMGNSPSLYECPENYSALPQRPLVINLGLAKSGTTSLHEFFRCSGWCSRHDWGTLTHAMLATLAFAQSQSTVNADAILRARLGTPADVLAEVNDAFRCVFPQVDHLDHLLRFFPEACFVQTTRPVDHWIRSLRGWRLPNGVTLLGSMITRCPIRPRDESGLRTWYLRHERRVRKALSGRQCALVIDIEKDPGVELARHFSRTNESCWGHHNARRTRMVPPWVRRQLRLRYRGARWR